MFISIRNWLSDCKLLVLLKSFCWDRNIAANYVYTCVYPDQIYQEMSNQGLHCWLTIIQFIAIKHFSIRKQTSLNSKKLISSWCPKTYGYYTNTLKSAPLASI